MSRTLGVLACLLLTLDCGREKVSEPSPSPSADRHTGVHIEPRLCVSSEAAVVETLFRYHVANPRSDAPDPRAYYFSMRGKDPAGSMLAAIASTTVPVHPGSQFAKGKGVLVSVRNVTLHSGEVAFVDGSLSSERLPGSDWRWKVICCDGSWVYDREGSQATNAQ